MNWETVLVVAACLTTMVAAVGLLLTKKWQFERAFFIALMGALFLGWWSLGHRDADRRASDQKQQDARLVAAMIITCQQTYIDIGNPVSSTNKEIRSIAGAAAKDAKKRLKNKNLTPAQHEQADRAEQIWSALAGAAKPVPKEQCEKKVRAELAGGAIPLPGPARKGQET